MSDSLEVPRYLTGLVVGFSVIALLLSIIGIYGVMSYFVQQHTRDIGIRMALGLAPARVRREIVGRGMRMVFLGVTIGAGAALVLTRFMASLLFEVSATDTVTFVGVTTGLVVIALTACVVPARRASQVDPAVTLREE